MLSSPVSQTTTSHLTDRRSPARSSSVNHSFPPVPVEELACALTIFVGAVNRKLPVLEPFGPTVTQSSLMECKRLFARLSADRSPSARSRKTASSTEASLPLAFAALWRQYSSDDLRWSICARVLGFYFLTERTGGKAIERFIELCPHEPETVLLHPAVVEGLAVVPLGPEGKLSEDLFVITVAELAFAHHELPPPGRHP